MLTVEDKIVQQEDFEAFNGNVHVIDEKLTSPLLSLADAIVSYTNATRFNNFIDKVMLNLSRGY